MNTCPTCGGFNFVQWAHDMDERIRQAHDLSREGEAVSMDEAAQMLRIGKTKFEELVATGEIPHLTIGTRKLIRRSALEEYLRNQEIGGPAWQEKQGSIVDEVFRTRTGTGRSTSAKTAASKPRSR